MKEKNDVRLAFKIFEEAGRKVENKKPDRIFDWVHQVKFAWAAQVWTNTMILPTIKKNHLWHQHLQFSHLLIIYMVLQ